MRDDVHDKRLERQWHRLNRGLPHPLVRGLVWLRERRARRVRIPVGILLIVAYAVALALLILWGWLVGAAVVGRWVWRRMRPLEGEPTLFRSLLVGILSLLGPAVLAHLLSSLGFMAPVATGLGIALSVVTTVVCFAFWIVGMGSLVATRAGQPPRVVAPSAGFTGAPPPPPPAPEPSPVAPPPATA